MRSKFNKVKQVWEGGWWGPGACTDGKGTGTSIGTPLPLEQTDKRHWKHYILTTSLAGGNFLYLRSRVRKRSHVWVMWTDLNKTLDSPSGIFGRIFYLIDVKNPPFLFALDLIVPKERITKHVQVGVCFNLGAHVLRLHMYLHLHCIPTYFLRSLTIEI